ncbi:MAG: hypothetical protein WKG06_01390 [Segetibacter sp.]
MKTGFIFECGPDGADVKVIRNLAQKILPQIQFEYATMDDKGRLLNECADAAERLFTTDKCERVFIVWDLTPPDKGACRKKDRDTIIAKLQAKGLPLNRIVLLCIEQELESWLIADGRALSDLLSTAAHPVKIADIKNPDQKRNPKKALGKILKENRGWYYVDRDFAESIVTRIPDFSRLRKSETFKRFHYKLCGNQI